MEHITPITARSKCGVGGDIKNRVPGVISWDLIGTYEKDAVNWTTLFPAALGNANNTAGWPTAFGPGGLKATISNNLAGMALLKWSFGSWGDPAPIVGKGPVAPSGPTGIPLTLYAGYQLIQFSNPTDPQTTPSRMTASNSISSTRPPARFRVMARRSPTTRSTPCAEKAPAAPTKFSKSYGPAPNTASPKIWTSLAPITTTFRTSTSLTALRQRRAVKTQPTCRSAPAGWTRCRWLSIGASCRSGMPTRHHVLGGVWRRRQRRYYS